AAVERAKGLGAEIVRFDLAPFREAALLLYAGPWVAERTTTVTELLARNPEAIHPVVRDIVLGGNKFTAADAFRAQYRLGELRLKAARVLAQCDALLLPTAPTHYTIEEVLENPLQLNARLGTYTNFVNLLDLSALAVPAGAKKSGLPFGITFMAPAFHDARLLELGRSFVAEPTENPKPAHDCVWLAVAGAHLSGQPLNHELTSRGAEGPPRPRPSTSSTPWTRCRRSPAWCTRRAKPPTPSKSKSGSSRERRSALSLPTSRPP
ncbi:MAG: Allophanate hydrolase, partial [Polyangiaceae bacterium]|nr:Allophanate hydrolase [Polyangiaceae bacterium]